MPDSSAPLPTNVCYVDATGFYIGPRYVVAQYLQREPATLAHSNQLAMELPSQGVAMVVAPNIQALWSMLRQYRQHLFAGASGDQTIHIAMPCGHMRRFCAFDDLPWSDCRCPCGAANHLMIRYYPSS